MNRTDATLGLEAVQRAIQEACRHAGRAPGSVTLVAVSKTVPMDVIEPVLAAGHRVFGENRVQEAKAKWPAPKARWPDLELHMIGPLQTNKVREAVSLFDAIHSVDRRSLCEALARECARQGRQPKLFVQVNTGAEPQKAGVLPGEVDELIAACRQTYGLTIEGLMCIPPVDAPPAAHFAMLAELAARNGLPLLSMGMSSDFATAIELGATHVRAGTAIFGSRPPPTASDEPSG
ncbi:MAG TPA: YggS family pyridoxal phosphate-dependent enzyme [Kofleriaceae bacterium]|nr:YggS family pyridoxal phosphate-dependent enzyme [Kofleriaceae bacterium]